MGDSKEFRFGNILLVSIIDFYMNIGPTVPCFNVMCLDNRMAEYVYKTVGRGGGCG